MTRWVGGWVDELSLSDGRMYEYSQLLLPIEAPPAVQRRVGEGGGGGGDGVLVVCVCVGCCWLASVGGGGGGGGGGGSSKLLIIRNVWW